MVEILRLANPNLIFEKKDLFEKAVTRFLTFLKNKDEKEETLSAICKDITITYEKLYNPVTYKKPLEHIEDIENDQLLYFVTNFENVYLGKIISKNKKGITVQLFRTKKGLYIPSDDNIVNVYIWRVGDAEYEFSTKILESDGNMILIERPLEFKREKEFRHPYMDVIVPAIARKLSDEKPEEIKATLFKLNDYEAIIRTNNTLDYKHQYELEFKIMDFQFVISSKIVANRTIEEQNIFYYTLRYQQMTEAAMSVLKRYIYEHL